MRLKKKRMFSALLSFCMLATMAEWQMSATVYADEIDTEQTAQNVSMEVGETYAVPLDVYNPNNSIPDASVSAGATYLDSFVDNVAIVKPLEEGRYQITLLVENYDKIDMFQVLKQGTVPEDTLPSEIPFGTWNIPEKYICNPEDGSTSSSNAVDEATTYLRETLITGTELHYMEESWNDSYIRDFEVMDGYAGTSYYTFKVGNLTDSLYIKKFASYGKTNSRATYASCISSGKIAFQVDNAVNVESLTDGGIELKKVSEGKGGKSIYDTAAAKKANDLISDVTVTVSNENVTATVQMNKEAGVESVELLTGIKDLGTYSSYPRDTKFQQYLYAYSTETISEYSENLLNEEKAFEVSFADTYQLVFGREIRITLEDGTIYNGELRLRAGEKETLVLEDGDITLTTDTYNVKKGTEFKANIIEEDATEGSEYMKLYALLAGSASKVMLYNPSLTYQGEEITPGQNVEIKIKIPDGWDSEKVRCYRRYAKGDGIMNETINYRCTEVEIKDSYVYISTPYVNETYAIIEEATQTNLAALSAGTYKTNVTLWQMNNHDSLSMSNNAVVNDSAYLVIKEDGTKYLSFDLQGIKIGTTFGYTNRIRCASDSDYTKFFDLEYYSYFTTESGGLDIDQYAVDYDLYYPETVGFELPSYAGDINGVYLQFYVPVMDELVDNTQIGTGVGKREAYLTFSDTELVAEYVAPSHDKSVLFVAVDKASKYSESDYTEESYTALATAVANVQEVISGETTADDAAIVSLDKAISDAISNLKEATGLDKYNKILGIVSALNQDDYTAESWADLQAVLAAQDGKVTEENADAAAEELQTAIDALIPLTDCVSLEAGIYETQASIVNTDGSSADINSGLKSARLFVDEDGAISVYLYTDGITTVSYRKGAGYESAEIDKTDDNGTAQRFAFTLPSNTETHKVQVGNGEGEGAYLLTLDLSNAVNQNIDTSVLKAKLDEANALTESDYTSETWQALVSAVEKAETAFYDKVAFQNEIQSAIDGIDSAIKGLVMTEEVAARKELEQLISDARQNYLASNYEEESFAALTEALEVAEKVLDDPEASTDSIKEQITLVNDAIKNLERLEDVVNKDTLNAYIADAKTKTNDDHTYTEKSWAAFQAAIVSASIVAEDVNATQEEVEKQAEVLNAAYQALVLTNQPGGPFEDYPQIYPGAYEVTIGLQNATSDEPSMGNAALNPNGIVRVTEDGKVTLEMNFQSMTFAGMEGYLYRLKKVDMDSVEYNQYNYPIKYEAEDAAILEEYTDVYDLFNDKESEYYDPNTNGEWYPKTLSIPINLNDNNFYVEVYVPVMESIGEGQGTKVARMVIDWANIKQVSGIERDNSVIEALFEEAQGMEQGDASDEVWNVLAAVYESAYEVYSNINATQEDIDFQVKALQAAIDAVEIKTVDTEALNTLLAEAEELLKKEGVVYTEVTQAALEQAIADTKDLLSKEGVTNAEVQAQMEKLQAAMDGLRTVDKSGLGALLEQAKEEYAKSDTYTEGSLAVLKAAITTAESVMNNDKATETDVNAAKAALTAAMDALISKETVDKSGLEEAIAEAESYLALTDVYTESSLSSLKSAIGRAQNVYDNASASQVLVDKQIDNLQSAIDALVKKSDEALDIDNLADGVYSIYGEMVKVDKETASMANNAINHTIKLTVKDGKYYLTMNFNGLKYAGQYGYLSTLKYFLTGYTTNKYGVPQGSLADVTIDSYQTDEDGNRIKDSFGTDYPDYVTFELIPEALKDGYVPLQVFVPIMESIADGTGTQEVYLKLDWSTLKLTEADDPDFDDDGNNGNNNNGDGDDGNGSGSGLTGGSGLGTNTLGGGSSLSGSSLGGSSLTGSSSLSGSGLSSASSVKTDDTSADIGGWAALLAIGCMVLLVGIMERRAGRKTDK